MALKLWFATETSDVDSKVFILPSFSDLCLNTSLLSKEIHYKNGEHIDLKDFRSLRIQLMRQNINYTEILFTEYCIINPNIKIYFINILSLQENLLQDMMNLGQYNPLAVS